MIFSRQTTGEGQLLHGKTKTISENEKQEVKTKAKHERNGNTHQSLKQTSIQLKRKLRFFCCYSLQRYY